MIKNYKSFFAFAPFVFACVVCNFVDASDSDAVITQGMNRVAKAVHGFLGDESLPQEIALGQIAGLPNMKSSGGAEVRRTLHAALEKHGVTVSDDAGTQIMGKYRLIEERQHPNDDFDSLGLEVSLQIMDENGNSLAEPEIKVWGKQILQIAGLNVDIPPKGSEKIRQKELIRQRHRPDTTLSGNRVSNKGPFAIEVIVNNRGSYDPRKPHLDSKKRPFVDLNLKEEYIVRIYNEAKFETAVTLLIDGVNVFVNAKQQGLTPESKFIVPAGGHADIPGWIINKHESKAFEISGYEGSVAEQSGASQHDVNIGTITAVFQASWPVGGERPADEPSGTAKGGKATKQGRDISKEYAIAVRDFGVIRSTISVRYDR